MDKLELSSDSIDSEKTKKRPIVVDSEDEAIDLPTKKGASFISQQKISKNNVEAITDGENSQIENESLKQENGNQISLNKNNCLMNKTIEDKKENTENKNSPSEKAAINISTPKDELEKEDIGVTTKSDETLNEEKIKDGTKKKNTFKNRTVDTEVVEGLELSVECASEKDEPSSESENENDVKPRPKTIIVKAEPNESELECSLSGGESDSQEATNMSKTKIEKRKKGSSQTSSNKLKINESDDSQENNSNEEYSPRTKKMNKLSTPKRLPKHSVVSRKRQNKDVRRSVRKKNIKHTCDENLEATSTGENKKEIRVKIETEEEISEEESIINNTESNNNSEDEDVPVKSKRKRRSNVKPEDHGKIQTLKKYLKVAGIRVKNYNNLWADCNTNVAKINRLKKLLEDNGIIGRPTLEKCKLARQKRERIKEISELDTSNIISEGRITRTRRNVTNIKKMSSDTDTSTQYQETRNIFKRIRTVVDSDSE